MSKRPILATAALVLATALAAPAGGGEIFPFPIHQQTLANGLTVIAVPYDSPGTLAYFTVVRTGSRDEVEPGKSGFAHFFEHMMFRGTERYSTNDYNDIVKRMGADTNAFTSDDYTNYYIIGPAAELETVMDIEADRFLNLEYGEDDFRREALAVLGEYNKNISNPFLPLYERMRELAFERHTYRHTTLGFLADIQAMPEAYDYSLGFFDRFYRPENTFLLAVGDVRPETVFALAERYYGGWERGYVAPAVAAEPPPSAGSEDALRWPAPIRPHLMVGYRAPAFTASEPDTAALDVISQLLFSESAPLFQKLVVEEQWVDFISGSYTNHRDPYLFQIFTRVKSKERLADVRGAIDEHIGRLESEPVAAERLERIKSHLRYSFANSLDSPGSVGFTVAAYLALTGEPETINELYQQYERITPTEIQRVARRVFRPAGRTVVTLSHDPEDAARDAAAAPAEGR